MLWRLYQRKLMLLFRRWRVSIARVSNEYSCWLRGFPWSLFSGPRPDVAKNVKISSCVAGDNSKASQKSTSRRAVVVRVVKAVISAEKSRVFRSRKQFVSLIWTLASRVSSWETDYYEDINPAAYANHHYRRFCLLSQRLIGSNKVL